MDEKSLYARILNLSAHHDCRSRCPLIMTRAVKRGLSRIKKPLSARNINLDEVAFKTGRWHIVVIFEPDARALALTDVRGTESLEGYFRTQADGK